MLFTEVRDGGKEGELVRPAFVVENRRKENETKKSKRLALFRALSVLFFAVSSRCVKWTDRIRVAAVGQKTLPKGRREGRMEQHNYCTPLLITGPVQTLVACLTAHLRYRTFNDLWCS